MRGAVVVPTYGRAELLDACLESLARLEAPQPRIVLVDGNAVVRALPRVRPPTLEVIRERNRGPGHARNTGYEAVKSDVEVVCFLDDDAVAAPDWFSSHVEAHARLPRAGAIGGRLENCSGPSTLARYAERVIFDNGPSEGGVVRTVASANYSVKVACLEEVGGFRTDLRTHEDVELNRRIALAGWDVVYDPGIVAGHHYITTWRAFLRQQVAYGRGFAHVRSEFPDLPGSELMRRKYLGAVAGTLPDALREARRSAGVVSASAAPVAFLRQLVFRGAALSERRRIERLRAQ